MKVTSIEIIKQLRAAGHEAYWAGGCVRDMLLGVHPKDFDIATSAKPEEIKKVLKKTIPIGEQFGVMLAVEDGHHFEIATFRSDGGYSDGRRPDAVLFTNAKQDALRRDFTINAMFYDPIKDEVLDFIGGQEDLKNNLLRFIGDPHERILEDHLRILRAIRFKNVYGLQYHPDTFAAVKKHAPLVAKVSGERIRDELNKMIIHESFAQALEDMEDTGVLQAILPELQATKGMPQPLEYHKEGDLWQHILLAVKALESNDPLNVRWAVFLHDIGKVETFFEAERIRFDHHAEKSAELAEKILRRLAFPKKDIEAVYWLIHHHMSVYNVLDMTLGRRRHWFLMPLFLQLLAVNRCDSMGTRPIHLDNYNKTLELYRSDLEGMPQEPKRLLTGEEIMELLKIEPGKKVQEVLDALRHEQLSGLITDKNQAIAFVEKLKK